MPRYFFNVYDDVIASDDEGMDLPNEQAARLHDIIGARDIMVEQVRRGYLVRSHWIDVVNDQGEVLLTVTFGDAVDIKE